MSRYLWVLLAIYDVQPMVRRIRELVLFTHLKKIYAPARSNNELTTVAYLAIL
jgi:hypothetical protein